MKYEQSTDNNEISSTFNFLQIIMLKFRKLFSKYNCMF